MSPLLARVVLLAAFPLLVLIGFGPNDQGYIEFWEALDAFQRLGSPWLTPLADPVGQAGFAGQAVRPLTLLHMSLAWAIFPDPFLGHFVLIALAVGLNGLLAWKIARSLAFVPGKAIAVACAMAWFPAWVGGFMPRTAHFQWAHAAILGALLLLLMWARGRIGAWAIALVALLLATALAFYEGVAIMALLVGFAVLAAPAPRRRRLVAVSLWFGTTFLLATAALVAVRLGAGSYQAALAAGGPQWTAVPPAIGMVFTDGLTSLAIPIWGFPSLLALIGGLVAAGLTLVVSRAPSPSPHPPSRSCVVIGIVLLALSPLAALVYVAVPAHILDPLRTFSVVGLPMVLGLGLIWHYAGGSRRTTNLVAAFLVGMLAINLIGQREFMHSLSVFQERVVETVNRAVTSDTQVVRVEDYSGALASRAFVPTMAGRASPYPDFYTLPPEILAPAASFVAGRKVAVEACLAIPTNPYGSRLPHCATLPPAGVGLSQVRIPESVRRFLPDNG